MFEQVLLRQSLLKKWAPYTIQERCQIIERKTNVKVHPLKLYLFYRKNNISYRRSCKTYKIDKWAQMELDEERLRYAHETLIPIL